MDAKKTPLAVATFSAVLSALCGLLVGLFPNFSRTLFQSWFHGIDLSASWNPNISIVSVIIGIISAFIAGYILTWIFVKVYQLIVK